MISSCFAAFLGLVTIILANRSTQEIFNQTTGGNSWGFVMPVDVDLATDANPRCALEVYNQGKYPLYAVHLEIIQTNPHDGKTYAHDSSVGDIGALDHRLISPADGVDIYPGKTSFFQVYVIARNRTVVEFGQVPAKRNERMKFRILDMNNQPIKNIVNPQSFDPKDLL